MRLHPKGILPLLATLAILLFLVWLINLAFPDQTMVHYLLYLAGAVFYVFCIRFFRRPYREVTTGEGDIVSGADGHVVVIEEIEEHSFFHDRRRQVSIFMSPLNVHVNWYPINGEIVYTQYHRGSHIPAWRPKASLENERMSVVIRNEHGQSVMMTQIAGFVARRVFTNAKKGAFAFQGEEAGIIRFGSRVDLILPLDAEIKVKIGQDVKGCETIIAKFQEK